MEQKNGVQHTLMANGIMFKIEQQSGLPEIISERPSLTELNIDGSDELPNSIDDEG